MRRRHTITLKELFGLLVDAAVGDAMADSLWVCSAHGRSTASEHPLGGRPVRQLAEMDFRPHKNQTHDTLEKHLLLGEAGSPSGHIVSGIQIIRIVVSLLLAVAVFILPLLAWA
jgi:hypothetical protein